MSASITSSTLDRKGRSNIFVKNNKVYLKVRTETPQTTHLRAEGGCSRLWCLRLFLSVRRQNNLLGDDIPIVVVLKACGMQVGTRSHSPRVAQKLW